jgi:ribosomal protein S18 acetylase RimI-like enzyme
MTVTIRRGDTRDLAFLEAMLFEAFFWDPAIVRPSMMEVRGRPDFAKLLAGWGRAGDRALIAEENGKPVGAAWFRLWTEADHSYGFVGEDVPEIAIAVDAAHRSKGIGRALLSALIYAARDEGFPALSLSVSPANAARRLYDSVGFRKVGESGTSWTYVLPLAEEAYRPCR